MLLSGETERAYALPFRWKAEKIFGPDHYRWETYFSSPQFEIGNSHLHKNWTACCTRYVNVSRGGFISEVVGRSFMLVEDNICILKSDQHLKEIKLSSSSYCSSGKSALDFWAEDKWRLFMKEASLPITFLLTNAIGNGSEDNNYLLLEQSSWRHRRSAYTK